MATVQRNLLRVALLIAAVLIGYWLVRITDARYILRVVLQRIQDLGPFAPLYFMGAYIVACLTFFPGVILTLGGGILFGTFWGTVYVATGATLGAACAFSVSRYVARRWVYQKFSTYPKFKAIDEAVAKDGWKIVGLIRLSPVFPFIALNFIFGLTRIPFVHFVIVTWIAIIPVSALFVYLGTLIGDLAALGNQPITTGRTKWIVSSIAAVSTLAVTVAISRIARRALRQTISEESENHAASE